MKDKDWRLMSSFVLLAFALPCGGADREAATSMAPPGVPTPREVMTTAEIDKVVPRRGGGEWPTNAVTTALSPYVIRRGEDAKSATYQECTGYTFLVFSLKRPRLVRLESGRLVMLATAWLHKLTQENSVIMTSDDEGKTWSHPREVNFYGQLVALGGERVGVIGGKMPLSEDGGETWTELDEDVPLPNGKPWWIHGSVGFDGKRIATVGFYPTEAYGPVAWTGRSVLRFSDDLGRTWDDPIPIPAEWQTSEGALTYAHDGALVVSLRTGPTPTLFNALSGKISKHLIGYNDSWRRLTTARTIDGGKTWTDYQVHFRFGKTHSELLTLPNGDILLTYAARIGELDGQIYRGIEAVLSHDNGKSWDWANRYYLFRWPMHQGMHSPQSVVLSDGRIMTVFLYHYDPAYQRPATPENKQHRALKRLTSYAPIGLVDAIFWKPE